MITVLVVAGAARSRLAALLDDRKRFHVRVAAPGAPLAEQVERARPDVVLVDHGPDGGARWLRELAALPQPPPVVRLADAARGEPGADALRSGIRGVLPRDASAEELGAAIEAAAAGLVVLHPALAPARVLAAAGRPRLPPADQPLTAREIEILGMMAEGLGNKRIAARLGISAHTVKFHVASLFTKLDARTRTEAVTIGLRRGLILI